MPGTLRAGGNLVYSWVIAPSLTPVAVATITVAEQNFTVRGLLPGDYVVVNFTGTQIAGVGIVNARVSAADTLTVAFVNPTAGSVTPTAGVYNVHVSRPDTPLSTQPTTAV